MYSRMSWAATPGRVPIGAQHGRGRFMRPKRASSANMMRSRRPRRAAGLSSQRQESCFFKSILRFQVTLGMKRPRHQLAPVVPVEQIIDRAVAGLMTDLLLVGSLQIMDVQHFAGTGGRGKTRQERLFLGQAHVLALASTVRLGLECLDATLVISHVRAVHRA